MIVGAGSALTRQAINEGSSPTDDYTYSDENLSETVHGTLYQQRDDESPGVVGQVTGTKVKELDGGTRGRYSWLESIYARKPYILARVLNVRSSLSYA